MHDPGPAYWFRFTPVGTSFLPHQGDTRGATLLHKPITPSQMVLLICGLTAAPCQFLCEYRQSCPGVAQAVSYVTASSTPPEGGQDWQEACEFWSHPFAPRSPKYRYCTPSSSQTIACYPIRAQATRFGYPEPPGGGKVWPHLLLSCWSLVLVELETAQQPDLSTGRPAENLPLPPPLRQDANLWPDRKPHLWYPSFAWDPGCIRPGSTWWTSAQARDHPVPP